MIPVRKPLTVQAGTTFEFVIRFKDRFRNIIDLTGYTALMHIREKAESATTLAVLSTENGGIIITGNLGKVTLLMPNVDISSGVYDLLLIAPSGKKYKPIKTSSFTVETGVTRA